MDTAHWFFTKLLKIDNSDYDKINSIVSDKLSIDEQKLLLSVTTKSVTVGVVIGTISGLVIFSIVCVLYRYILNC